MRQKYITVFIRLFYLLAIIGSIYLIGKGILAYFLYRTIQLQRFIVGIIFFGSCLIAGLIFLSANYKGLIIDNESLSRRNSAIAIFSLIFSLCSLFVSLYYKVKPEIKVMGYIGFIFFGIGAMILLKKRRS